MLRKCSQRIERGRYSCLRISRRDVSGIATSLYILYLYQWLCRLQSLDCGNREEQKTSVAHPIYSSAAAQQEGQLRLQHLCFQESRRIEQSCSIIYSAYLEAVSLRHKLHNELSRRLKFDDAIEKYRTLQAVGYRTNVLKCRSVALRHTWPAKYASKHCKGSAARVVSIYLANAQLLLHPLRAIFTAFVSNPHSILNVVHSAT